MGFISETGIESVMDVISKKKIWQGVSLLSVITVLTLPAVPPEAEAAKQRLSKDDFEKAEMLYFQRCAGCHGVLRKGIIGKNLEPKRARRLGRKRLEAIMTHGTGGGMNSFDHILKKEEITLLASYLQIDPPTPPEMDLETMKDLWSVYVGPKEYPSKPMHGRNWENFFLVILRDEGKIAVIDGDKKEIVTKIDTGYAVHVVEGSSDGRFWYSMGRDGRMTKIDLWMDPPQVVAEVQVAYSARDISLSSYGKWKDKYLLGGGYWPPHVVIVDAVNMEPLRVLSTRGADIKGRYVNESRVAAIDAIPNEPAWLVAAKDLGQIWRVDYSDIEGLAIKQINSHKSLHNGFFDPTGEFYQAAAPHADRIDILDVGSQKIAASIKTGDMPYPSPGASWVDPKCGPVSGTAHLGDGVVLVWGSDPEKYPEQAWKICYSVETDGPGMFIRSHPRSKYVWVDQVMDSDNPENQQTVAVIDKKTRKVIKKLRVTKHPGAVALHAEFNKGGTEVWVSVWPRTRGDKKSGEIVVYDADTLKEVARITGLETPTGKFNVYNRTNVVN